ncbi:MAG: hypothetical protein ACK5IM_09260 [Demequina sp.]|uniref:hypothetical protein n=1 Tax=Demequina sp. TaxID=2050685 RepID=UPI003A848619
MSNVEPQDPTAPPQWPGATPDSGVPAWVTPASGQSGAAAQPGAGPGPGAPVPPHAAPRPAQYTTPSASVPTYAAPTYRSWQPGILALKPMSFGDFLSVPFRAIRYNRGVMLGAPLLFTLVSTILTLTALWVVFNDPQLGLLSVAPTMSGISGESIGLIVIAVACMLLADVLSSSIIAPGVARAVLGERITIGTAWRQVRRRLGSLVLLYLTAFAAMCVVGGLALLPLFLLLTGDGGAIAIGILLTLVAFALCVPVFLAITLLQGIARALIVLEDVSIGAGLKRTFSLIKGRFWWSMLIAFVTLLLINVAAGVVQNVGQFGALAVGAIAPESDVIFGIAFFVVYGLAYVLSMLMVYSYLGAVFALIYIDLRMRHEGFDIDLARAAEARAAGRA